MPVSKVPTFGHNAVRLQAVDVAAQPWPAAAPAEVAGTAAPGPRKRLNPAECRRLPVMPARLDKLASRVAAALKLRQVAAAGRALVAAAPASPKREPVQQELASLVAAAVADGAVWVPPIPEAAADMDLSDCPRNSCAGAGDSETISVSRHAVFGGYRKCPASAGHFFRRGRAPDQIAATKRTLLAGIRGVNGHTAV